MKSLHRETAHRPSWRDEGYLRQILDALPAAAYTCDTRGLITYYNRRAVEVWGREPRLEDESDRFCGSFRLYDAGGSPLSHDRCWMALALRDEHPYDGCEVIIERPDRSRRTALAHANPLRDPTGRIIGAVNVLVNITERKRTEEQLAHQATHDDLTGLPNRTLLQRRLDDAVSSDDSQGGSFALLLLDLDRFKEINDAFGHGHGDRVLQQLRPRLLRSVRAGDTVARLGGDEFGIMLPGANREGASSVAERIIASCEEPFVIDGQVLSVGASLGVALFPEHGRDAGTLLRRADSAMYASKRRRNGRPTFASGRDDLDPGRLTLAAELGRGIEAGELRLHYQPMINLASEKVAGAEALIRWQHPRMGLIMPDVLIPLADRSGLLRTIGLWTLREAIRQGREWDRLGMEPGVSVNLAPETVQDDRLADEVVRLLEQAGAEPGWLTIEVTESAMMADPEGAKATLTRLHAIGVKISIDDFGTGFSSLAYLKDLPVDELKVDRCFVKGMAADGPEACIVHSVIGLGHNLNIRVVAEGVEDQAVARRLREWGCDVAQGFYYCKPLPPEELVAFLGGFGRSPELRSSPPAGRRCRGQGMRRVTMG